MKIVKKNVYYCDFCKKKSLRPLTEHEKHCTGNPDRECGICGRTESLRPLIEKFKAQISYDEIEDEFGNIGLTNIIIPKIADIEEAVIFDNYSENKAGVCPACKLAILRGAGMLNIYIAGEFEYNREKEFADFWREVNVSRAENYDYGNY